MEPIFDEEMIRAELRRLDAKTGFRAADLPIKFGNARSYLGRFSYPKDGRLEFYFSNYYFRDPNLALEEKLNVIRHEYAHFLDYKLHGSSSHGPLWKQCCKMVDAVPIRCFRKEYSNYYVAKHKKEQLLNEKYNEYCIGLSIIHPMFGKGQIIDIMGEGLGRVACIVFDGVGVKRIAISWIDSNCKKQ